MFEVGFTTSLRFLDGFKSLPAIAAFLICVAMSLLFLEIASASIPLGTAYAVWTGMGAVGTVLIGMIWFREPATIIRGLMTAARTATTSNPEVARVPVSGR